MKPGDPDGHEMKMNAEMEMNAYIEMIAEMHAERQSYPWARMTTFWCTPENIEHIQHGSVLPDEANPDEGIMIGKIQHGSVLPDEEKKIIDPGGTEINFESGEELAAEESKPNEPGEEIADDESKPQEQGEEIADGESKLNALTSGGQMRRLLGG